MLLAPLLAHGNAAVTIGYRIAFATSIVAFVGASYTFSLQARDLHRWNVVRVSQPVLSLIVIGLLWRLRLLTLDHRAGPSSPRPCCCSSAGPTAAAGALGWRPGARMPDLVRPLAAYGAAQIAALTPAALNAQLDQLVLSQTVPPADLGRYAIAVSLTLLPVPLVSAIGNVAFPRLASQRAVTGATLPAAAARGARQRRPGRGHARAARSSRRTGWCRWSSAPATGAPCRCCGS